ncbi:MAG TPA: hypothetical protein VFX63_18720, partial [Pyrinomonadaceae bacterium]|nr:hypothetical protein [Pyrinomonadaceae bacterium]
KRLKIFPAPGCSRELRKIEIKHDERSGSSRGGVYHPSTFNSHLPIDVDSDTCIGHRAIGHNRDATVDNSSRGLRVNGRTAQDEHPYANDQERYEGRAE